MRGARLEGSAWGGKIAIGAFALLLLTAVGLAIYGGLAVPPQADTVKVLPNDRFPH